MAFPAELKGGGIPLVYPAAGAAPIHPSTHVPHTRRPKQRAEGELERRHRKYESAFGGLMAMRRPNAEVFTPQNALPLEHAERHSRPRPRHGRSHSEPPKQQDGLPGPPAQALPQRPRTWRSGYSINGGPLFGGFRLGKDTPAYVGYSSAYNTDTVARTLNPHLDFHADSSTISMDLRIPPNFPTRHVRPVLNQMGESVHLPNIGGRQLNPNDLMQYATNPPVNSMWLYHKRIPWYITIVPSSGIDEFVRVGDVIMGLFEGLTGTGVDGASYEFGFIRIRSLFLHHTVH